MIPRARGGDAATVTASILGRGLGGVFGVAGRLRHTDKPLHPRGSLSQATLTRVGLEDPTGVAWLDERGQEDVTVRLSRAIGLPPALPDILGLAVRLGPRESAYPGQHADLLFATTGLGPVTRFLLRPARAAGAAPYSTLMPYRTPRGAVLLAAIPSSAEDDRLDFDLELAAPLGRWRRFGQLRICQARREVYGPDSADSDVAFDPMSNIVPGMEPYEWVRQLRQWSYRAARHSRGDTRRTP